MKATILKTILFLSILSLIILGLSKAQAHKGSDYIQYEREMIESGQMNVQNSEYFIKIDGNLELK